MSANTRKPFEYFPMRAESDHYLDRRKIPMILLWIVVGTLLFIVPNVIVSMTVDGMNQHTLVQIAALKHGAIYPPADPHAVEDGLLAIVGCVSFACSIVAFAFAVRGLFRALRRYA